MMKKRSILSCLIVALSLSLLLPVRAVAGFTGIIDMNLRMPNGTSDIIYFLGNDAQRMDMTSELDNIPEPLRTTVITRESQPDEAVIINHKAGTYSRVNLQTAVENATFVDFDTDYRIERAGTEEIDGFSCEHVRLFSSTEKIEMWLTGDIGDFRTFRLLQSQNPRLSNTVLSQKLRSEGIDGFPVRMVQENESGITTMQIVSWQPAPLQDAEFEIPPHYTEVRDTSEPLNDRQKEHLKDLMEKIRSFQD
ncbi:MULTISPECIES: DUF4412 domain-containing protein [Prosthecochloris]|nr:MULTISPECIES: DUF4412 domain-containing protein [Prosthecochloris]